MKRSLPALVVFLLAATIAFSAPDRPAQRPKSRPPVASNPVRSSPRAQGPGRSGGKVPTPPGTARPVARGGASCAVSNRERVDVCSCVGTCGCWSGCWCHGTHPGSSAGTTGTSAGGTTAATTGSATSGSTTGGSTSGTTSTTASTTGGTNSGGTGTTTGGTGGTTGTSAGTTGGATGSSTGGDTAGGATTGTSGSTGGGAPWDVTADGIAVEGVAPGGYVSGTKVEASFTLRLKRPATGSNYDTGVVTVVEIRIGGEVDSAVPFTVPTANGANVLTPNPTTGECAYGVRVRFASTRFLDAKRMNLNATFRYRLQSSAGDSPPLAATLRTVHVVTYNKGLPLWTEMYVNCQSSVYAWEAPPGDSDNYDHDSQVAIPYARNRLLGMGHAELVGGPSLGREAVLDRLNAMTAFFAFTHGEPTGILPSYGAAADKHAESAVDKMTFSGGVTSDIGKATWGRATTPARPLRTARPQPLPRPNLVLLHACSGLGSSGTSLMQAFGLMEAYETLGIDSNAPPPASAIDRAVAAFPDVVDMVLWSHPVDGSEIHLSDHAGKVYEGLAKGLTIQDAVFVANRDHLPAHSTCLQRFKNYMAMQVKGDPYARLVSVYTGGTSTTSPNASPNRPPNELGPGRYPYRWYLVNP